MNGHCARTAIRRPGCKVLTSPRPSDQTDTRIRSSGSSRICVRCSFCYSCDGAPILGYALKLCMDDPPQRQHVFAGAAHHFVVAVEVTAALRLDQAIILVDHEV